MRATVSLDGILAFLQSLSLSASNKQWLAEKLLEEARKEKEVKKQSYEDFINGMCGAWKDDSRSTDEIIADIRNSRQFGVTRHIIPLTDEKQ